MSHDGDETDEALMCLLADGDKGALESLCRRYQNDLFRFCVHYMKDPERARDMTQETFIRVYLARARFDTARRFKPWVLCIARNLCLNELKRKKAVPMESLEEYASDARNEHGELLQSEAGGPDELLMTKERHGLLHDILAELDPAARELVMMRFFERLSARDIAEVMGSTEGAIRTRLHRVLKGLREQYADTEDWE